MGITEHAKCKKCDGVGFYLSAFRTHPCLCCEICGGNGVLGLPWLGNVHWEWDAHISRYILMIDIMCDGEKLMGYGISESVLEGLPRPQPDNPT